jgi:hypothetical protein
MLKLPDPSWDEVIFPPHIQPLPLDESFQPVDLGLFDQLQASHGRFIFVAPQWSRLNPEIIGLVQTALASRPDVGIFYGDDAVVDEAGSVLRVCCKPSFNKALLLAKDYIAFPLIIRTSVFETVRLATRRDGAAWFEFILAAAELGTAIERIPETLIATASPRAEAGMDERRAIIEKLAMGSPFTVAAGRAPNTLQIRRRFEPYPDVTIVVPTDQRRLPTDDPNRQRAGRPHIINFLDSLKASSWPMSKIHVLIGDNHEDDAIYRGRKDPFHLERVVVPQAPGPFNLAKKINVLWRQARTELLVLMNDDIVVVAPDWLQAVMTFAMDSDVGYVGARLLYPDGRIQHAGMFGSIFGVCAHPWYLQDGSDPTYEDWALTQRDVSVATGAMFATRKSVMEAVQGFDERFSLDFNDVDCCLRMRLLGYRVIYAPDAEMIHYEKATRQDVVAPGQQVEMYLRRWRDFLEDDPMFSPQLRSDTSDVAPHPLATRWL